MQKPKVCSRAAYFFMLGGPLFDGAWGSCLHLHCLLDNLAIYIAYWIIRPWLYIRNIFDVAFKAGPQISWTGPPSPWTLTPCKMQSNLHHNLSHLLWLIYCFFFFLFLGVNGIAKPSCETYRLLGHSADGYFEIDPDEDGPLAPFTVWCKFSTVPASTVVSHDK